MSFFRLPRSIRQHILRHWFNRVTGRSSSNHEIIWTSFFYYAVRESLSIKEDKLFYRITIGQPPRLWTLAVRGGLSTDVFVFFQIFIKKEYDPLFNFIERRGVSITTIIDAGANVGFFSIWAIQKFPQAAIHAIEPVEQNFHVLRANLTANDLGGAITAHQAALWPHATELALVFADDWTCSVSETISDGVRRIHGVTVQSVVASVGWHVIDLLKIDIEGGEGALFKSDDFVLFLSRVKIIAMEIHDNIVDRNFIYSRLKGMNFAYENHGEMTIAWNTSYVTSNG